ncbi:MAG: peptidase [Anaerosolibacter sp.]|uniref:hypothetical protein n=1 Tax=Anaerosolibacter sp. TaxID=1872527 RepID=UPI00262C79D9|nr:hypothetical protein [Anaerosolibacter sp.]MDF2546937.1 peptidase [Anaerosolibacter sp.]
MFKKVVTTMLISCLTFVICLPIEATYAAQNNSVLSLENSKPVKIAHVLNKLAERKSYLEEAEKKIIENIVGLELYEEPSTGNDITSALQKKYFLDYELNMKLFTLRGRGKHVEIWVANDLSYSEGDVRKSDVISDDEIKKIEKYFEDTIYSSLKGQHEEVQLLKGGNSWLVEQGFLPENYYVSDSDEARTMILIDNIKDEWYYNENQETFISAYYWNIHNKYINRDIIMLNSKEWKTKFESVYLPALQEEFAALLEDNK